MKTFTFCFLLAVASFFNSSCKAQPNASKPAHDITLPDVTGNKISLSSLKGKVVLIDFWASWCRPCRQTVPGLKKLYSLYHDKGFEIYGISLDENKNVWRSAIEKDQSTWIHVNDDAGIIATQWSISVIPTTFLLNKSGKIVAANLEGKELNKAIEKLLQ